MEWMQINKSYQRWNSGEHFYALAQFERVVDVFHERAPVSVCVYWPNCTDVHRIIHSHALHLTINRNGGNGLERVFVDPKDR